MNLDESSSEEELRLAPTDPDVDESRRRFQDLNRQVGPVPDDPPAQSRFQFRLLHLIGATTIVAILTALLQWFDAVSIAVVLGMSALFLLIAMGIVQVQRPAIRFAWWCLLGFYLFFVILAFVAG